MRMDTNPLTDPDWLGQHLGDADVRILDASFFLPNQNRHAREEFQQVHIPGSGFFDIDAVADASNPLPHMLPSAADFAAAVGRLGIDRQNRVVVYDNNSFMASARAWWMFRVFGHSRVSVLDGGLQRWTALGLPLESGPATAVTPSDFAAVFHPGLVRDFEGIQELLREASAQLLDARSPGRFAGTEPEPRAGLRSGHIPESRNLFFKRLLDDASGCMKTREALEQEFLGAGIDPRRPVVCTCGTGVTAAILALGLFRLGNEYAAVYDGSWTEWGGRSDTPVVIGA